MEDEVHQLVGLLHLEARAARGHLGEGPAAVAAHTGAVETERSRVRQGATRLDGYRLATDDHQPRLQPGLDGPGQDADHVAIEALERLDLRDEVPCMGGRRQGVDVLRTVIAPRALAGMFSVLLLAATSGVIALVVAYLMVHGFSPWAFERFTRLVGHVFSPAVSMVFVLKTLGLAAAVSLLPLGSALHDRRPGANVELQGLLRMFVIILLIELLSLMGNYL